MQPEGTDNGGNGIFINTGLGVQDFLIAGAVLVRFCNGSMELQRNLGIRDNGAQEERMGVVAGIAEDTGNLQRDDLILQTQLPRITAIPDEASSMPAGAGDEV